MKKLKYLIYNNKNVKSVIYRGVSKGNNNKILLPSKKIALCTTKSIENVLFYGIQEIYTFILSLFPMPTAKKSNKKTTSTPIKKKPTVTKKTTPISTNKPATTNKWLSNSAVMGLLHLVGWVLGSRWWLAVIIYYIIKKENFNKQDMDIFYNIINFNLSFLLYAIVSALLVVILIWVPMLAVVSVAYIVLLVISSISYISDKPYKIPFSIQILK